MTAAGDVKFNTDNSAAFRSVCLFTGLAAVNGQPSASTDGVPVYQAPNSGNAVTGASYIARASREAVLFLKGSGTGTVAGTFRLWGYLAALGEWVPVGATPAGDTTKGTINAGVSIGETKADKVLHCEPFLLAGLFDRLYLECSAISGTLPSFEAWLTTAHRIQY